MELVKINKISVNKKDYFKINGFLDLENLSFQFDLSFPRRTSYHYPNRK